MGNGGPETCDNGVDDNENGFIDCADVLCKFSADCSTQAPTMSPVIVAFLVIALAAIGFLSLGLLGRQTRHGHE